MRALALVREAGHQHDDDVGILGRHYHFDPQTNVIDVHMSRLRSKIDKGHATPLLHTVRGAGYMIRE